MKSVLLLCLSVYLTSVNAAHFKRHMGDADYHPAGEYVSIGKLSEGAFSEDFERDGLIFGLRQGQQRSPRQTEDGADYDDEGNRVRHKKVKASDYIRAEQEALAEQIYGQRAQRRSRRQQEGKPLGPRRKLRPVPERRGQPAGQFGAPEGRNQPFGQFAGNKRIKPKRTLRPVAERRPVEDFADRQLYVAQPYERQPQAQAPRTNVEDAWPQPAPNRRIQEPVYEAKAELYKRQGQPQIYQEPAAPAPAFYEKEAEPQRFAEERVFVEPEPVQDQEEGASYVPSYHVPSEQRSIEAAVAAGANSYNGETYEEPKRVSFQIHGQEGPHSYRFGYDTGVGYNRQFRYEERDDNGVLHGRYGYYDQEGKLQIVNYTADPYTGFHAEGEHVPKPGY